MNFFRAVLEKKLERLERRVGDISRGTPFSAWGDDADLLKQNAAGLGQIRHAIVIGRRALESGDDQQTKEAVAVCENLDDFAQARAKQKGGRTRGDDQTRAADERWKPWRDLFDALKASGLTDQKARAEIKRQMSRADQATWPTPSVRNHPPEFPSDKILAQRLRSGK